MSHDRKMIPDTGTGEWHRYKQVQKKIKYVNNVKHVIKMKKKTFKNVW